MARTKSTLSRQAEPGDSVEVVFRAFLGTSGLLRTKMRDYFQRFGISGAQWGVLRVLNRAEKEGHIGIRLTDIGDRVLITPPSVTGVVNRLEKLGWVTREAAPDDQRAKHVVLTESGRAMVARVIAGHRARVHSVMAGLGEQELNDMHRLLVRLGDHLDQLKPDAN